MERLIIKEQFNIFADILGFLTDATTMTKENYFPNNLDMLCLLGGMEEDSNVWRMNLNI